MAHEVITDGYFSANSVDLSDHVVSMTVHTERDEVDVTTMGSTSKVSLPGLGDATIEVTFLNDFAAGEVYATLDPLSTTSTPFPVAARRSKTLAISATNPEFQMQALMYNWDPLAASVGERNEVSVTFRNAAQSGITRDITP